MAKLEEEAATRAAEPIKLLDGSPCEISKWLLVLDRWPSSPPFRLSRTYESKPLISWNGAPLYAELVILEVVKSNGWEGVWIDSFHRKFLACMPGAGLSVDLPANVAGEIDSMRSVYRRISVQYPDARISRGKFGGCWDVLCWKGDELLFIEAKRRFKDHVQQSQAAWLMAALACGKSANSFRIAEWTLQR